MARVLTVILILVVAVFSGLFWFLAYRAGVDNSQTWVWVEFYRQGLRTPLFSGLLTIGGFLLTLKTSILLRIKEIYDSPGHEKNWRIYRDQLIRNNSSAKPRGFYYGFQNLGVALLANVVMSLSSAILQVTVGFINRPWAIGVCLGFAATALILLLFLWFQIASNLMRWFTMIEDNKQEQLRTADNGKSGATQT